jgi:hypothetical protein
LAVASVARTRKTAATDVIRHMSAEPARSWAAAAAPSTAADAIPRSPSRRSSPSRTQGIQARPEKWWYMLAAERNGPDRLNAAAATNDATSDSA